jgi:hypothetical protein
MYLMIPYLKKEGLKALLGNYAFLLLRKRGRKLLPNQEMFAHNLVL